MFAIVSDIHGNLEALQAVMLDVQKRNIPKIVCLGDIVGYGPDPRDCMDLICERADTTIMGNHDFATLFEPRNFNYGAERACFWTRSTFEDDPDHERRNRRWEFIGRLKVRNEENGFLCLHGSPRRPINEYIFPDDIYANPNKMVSLFDRITGLCFVGHTHVPGVFLPDPDFYAPDELEDHFPYDVSTRAIINVGSVGQPRDRDPRSSYVIVEKDEIRFIRIEYDINTTAKKIYAIPELDDFEGNRLFDGR